MPGWSFLDWVAYGGIAIAATMQALDQGIRRSSTPPKLVVSITKTSFWAYTPFFAILLSAVIIVWHLLSPTIPETKPPEVTGPPVSAHSQPMAVPVHAPDQPVAAALPSQLSELTNQDIRQWAYVFHQQLQDLEIQYVRNKDNLTGSADQVASATLAMDEKLNREFKQQYQSDVLRLELELARRLKIDDSRDASIPNGRLDLGKIGILGNHLVNLANQLP
jgi:hypothetical protein